MGGHSKNFNKATTGGLLIALGIIYGDIGTSPLYTINSIIADKVVSRELVLGALSCIIWTLTLLTTIKYVWLVLRADNNNEGGIFSLYALVRRRRKWLFIPAMIGGASLIADGIITPALTVTSAVEGLKELPMFAEINHHTIRSVVIVILCLFFFMQQFGTEFIGKFFGPIMMLWFGMLGILGITTIHLDYSVLEALSPHHAIQFLTHYPKGFWLLGAVFLCTTGAEALYSDLGHCGRGNIRVSWIFVKTCLLLNYLGQGAYMLKNLNGVRITAEVKKAQGINIFYDIMPDWLVVPGVIIATMAAIIASQALISGAFTLISEAMRLNLWPKLKINFPTNEKGQIYIPALNWILFTGCILMIFKFDSSSEMEAAYGLAIVTTLIATTILFANYLVVKRYNKFMIYLFLFGYLTIEFGFLIANIPKFPEGGYITLLIAGIMFSVMFVWYKSRKIKNRYVEFDRIDKHLATMQDLSSDESIPKFATHLVYLTSANNAHEIETKIIYSILNKKPKRADIYWFIHVDVVDEPYRMDYVVDTIIPNEVIRIEFRLGFRVEQRINLLFRKVVEDMVKNKEVNIASRYESLGKNKVAGDWQFVVMEKFLSHDNDLPLYERLIMNIYFFIKKLSLSEERGFGLDSSYVLVEKYPLVVAPVKNIQLNRIEKN
jgi:KUP system potassium uptake protein